MRKFVCVLIVAIAQSCCPQIPIGLELKGHQNGLTGGLLIGQYLVTTGGRGEVFAWDLSRKTFASKLTARSDATVPLIALNGQELLTGGSAGYLEKWDLDSKGMPKHAGVYYKSEKPREFYVLSKAPDSKEVLATGPATNGIGTIDLISDGAPRLKQRIEIGPHEILQAKHLGKDIVAVTGDRRLHLITIATDQREIVPLKNSVSSASITREGVALIGYLDGSIELWTPGPWRMRSREDISNSFIYSLAVSENDALLAATDGKGLIKLFSLKDQSLTEIKCFDSSATAYAISVSSESENYFLFQTKKRTLNLVSIPEILK